MPRNKMAAKCFTNGIFSINLNLYNYEVEVAIALSMFMGGSLPRTPEENIILVLGAL
jgi:hypothetical protein